MSKCLIILMILLIISTAVAIDTKEDDNYKITFLIGSGLTTSYDDIKTSSVMGETGIGNYTDSSILSKIGILYMWGIEELTISNLNAISITTESVYIGWNCSENCNYSILVYDSTSLISSVYNNSFALSHKPFFSGLTSNTLYKINLTVWNYFGNTANNNTYNFTTLAEVIVPEEVGGAVGAAAKSEKITKQKELRKQIEEAQVSFMHRLFRGKKNPDDGICDDGENFVLDKDCTLTKEIITSGGIFYTMWFIRLMLLIGIFMFFEKSKSFPLVIMTIIALFFMNGAFGTISAPSKKLAEQAVCNTPINFIRNLGGCLWPAQPVTGWVIGFALLGLFLFYIWKKPTLNLPIFYKIILTILFLLLISASMGLIKLPKTIPIDQSICNTLPGFFRNLGGCLWPTQSLVGWSVVFVISVLILWELRNRLRKRKGRKTKVI